MLFFIFDNMNITLSEVKKMLTGKHNVIIKTARYDSPFNKGRGENTFGSKFQFITEDIKKYSTIFGFAGTDYHYPDLIAEKMKKPVDLIQVGHNKIGEWVPGYEGIILKNANSGKLYLRVYSTSHDNIVEYYHDKNKINIHDPKYKNFLKPKLKTIDDTVLKVMNINIDNITSIEVIDK